MKELSIEEKAKLYDKAIAHARSLLKTIGNATLGNLVLKNEFKTMFPVLEESEDEMIRNALITYHSSTGSIHALDKFTSKEICVWLEKQGEKDLVTCPICGWEIKKQGEQKPSEWHREDEQNLNACLGYIPDEFLRRWLTDIIHVKYDKPADKVEPKIKAGDWVVCNNGPHHIFQVIERSWPNAKYRDLNGTEIFLNVNTLDKQYHLWTIQDAKDGDVLAVEHIGRYKFPFIAIYKNYGLNFFNSYCSIGFDGKFYEADTEHVLDDIHPATKEQRETLLKAMHEAGYEWDAEKKELKKVEQKPADYIPKFHVGDKLVSTKNPRLTYDVLEVGHINELGNPEYKVEIFTDGKVSNPRNIHYMECYKVDEWAKHIEQKPVEWGEEDELNIKELLYLVKTNYLSSVKPHDRLISFLESLKDRVQLQDRIDIEVWVTKNKQWILKLNGKVVRGQWGDEPQCIYKQFFYLSEIESLKE